MPQQIHVAIGILMYQQQVLVGWREAAQHQGNKHEFPGGKVEPNESPWQACQREIEEEVGITELDGFAWPSMCHEYADLTVHLHVFASYLNAQQVAQIQAPWQWYHRDALRTLNFPQANVALIERLNWPKQLADTDFCAQAATDLALYVDAVELDTLHRLEATRYLVACRTLSQVLQAQQWGCDALVIDAELAGHALIHAPTFVANAQGWQQI